MGDYDYYAISSEFLKGVMLSALTGGSRDASDDLVIGKTQYNQAHEDACGMGETLLPLHAAGTGILADMCRNRLEHGRVTIPRISDVTTNHIHDSVTVSVKLEYALQFVTIKCKVLP